MKLSIIIPAYNEEKRILRTLEDYYHTFSTHFGDDFELIVEMDGCIDNTPKIVKEFVRGKSNVKVLEFKEKLGKGGGIRKAFEVAMGKIVGFTDADDSTPAKEFLKLTKEIEKGYDVVLGSRWLKESKVFVPQPLYRQVLSRGFNLLVRLLFGLNIRDTQCGAKVFRKEVIDAVLPHLQVGGFAFDVELLYLAHKKGFKINEVPIEWYNDEDSTLDVKKVVPEMFMALVRMRLKYL
ncbi:MAG: glycosyltransferase family 2 protein [Thermosipho sp. (in: Bacteria)]|nr:glycosyltransferase family 2 protein [Thermosipho sp. (in: thermotogales)]